VAGRVPALKNISGNPSEFERIPPQRGAAGAAGLLGAGAARSLLGAGGRWRRERRRGAAEGGAAREPPVLEGQTSALKVRSRRTPRQAPNPKRSGEFVASESRDVYSASCPATRLIRLNSFLRLKSTYFLLLKKD